MVIHQIQETSKTDPRIVNTNLQLTEQFIL